MAKGRRCRVPGGSLSHAAAGRPAWLRSCRPSRSRSQFQRGLGFTGASSLFVERVFQVMFDVEGSGWIDFKRFVDGIHRLSSYESQENKIRSETNKRA